METISMLKQSRPAGTITVTRKIPRNYDEKDRALFEGAFTLEIPQRKTLLLRHAAVIKHAVFNPSEFRFANDYTHIRPFSRFSQFKKLYLYALPGKRVEKAIWITDEWSAEYYHWLSDALTRLLAVEGLKSSHVVLLPERYREKPYVEASLRMLGFRWEYYSIRRIVRTTEMVLPAHTAPTGHFSESAINGLRNRFVHPGATPFRKIFISRKKAIRRRILNEAEVTALMAKHGYEVHYFEDYDFATQIRLMSETKILMGLHGAGLTNMLFMQPGTQLLEIRNEGESHLNCFFNQASALDIEYYYMLSQATSAETHTADFTVDVDKLEKAMVAMEGDV